jgi:hypothetical protein
MSDWPDKIQMLASHALLSLRATCPYLDKLCDEYIMRRILDEMRDDNPNALYLHTAVK